MTLLLHEVHDLIGTREDEFEASYRDAGGWMDRLAAGSDARLLYFLHQAHGSGPSYRAVTITAVADGAAWERLVRRQVDGDLTGWALATDALRYRCTAKVLLPVAWSALVEIDLAAVPVEPGEHEPGLFMEDTGWPDSSLDDYVDFWGRDYYPLLAQQPEGSRLLEIQACWVPAWGTGRRKEAILWQKVHSMERLVQLLTREVQPSHKAPGTYMAEGLRYRDQWESRLLRAATWSPWW